MHKHFIGLLFFLGIACAWAEQATAIPQFQRQFLKLYVGDNRDSEFAEQVKRAKCWVCHQGKKRTNHNPYGIHLVDLLDKKEDMKKPEKIIAALEKVAKLHSDPNDPESPTYEELIKAGKLPGGSLEEAKKEPEE